MLKNAVSDADVETKKAVEHIEKWYKTQYRTEKNRGMILKKSRQSVV